MNILKNQVLALVMLLIMVAAAAAVLPVATASNPPIEIPTYAYLAISPNPVGINQPVFLVMWLHAAPPTAAGIAGDRWRDFTVTVTKPDGTTETKGPYLSDPTGSIFTLYTPTQIGTYKFDFNYPGQVLSLYHPESGLPGSNSPYINDTWLPSSATEYLTVQQEPIALEEDYPLPTSYWTRPIEAQNQAWSQIASNWLGGSYFGAFQQTGYNIWQTNGVAPNSPHIMWTKPFGLGGIVGGNLAIPAAGFYTGGSYEGRFANAIIMAGMLYYQEPLGHSNAGGGFACVNLQTGEEIWRRDDIGVIGGSNSPTFGQLYDYESMNQHGIVGGILWATPSSTQYDPTLGTLWVGYDALTGKLLYNLTNIPSGTTVYTDNGEIVRYVFSYNTNSRTGSLRLWNNTAEQMGLHGATGTGSSAYQWRPNGKSVNMSNAYSWNVTINADLRGNANPAIVYVLPGDVIFGRSSGVGAGVGDKFTPDPWTVWAISDKPATRGQLLWIKSYPAPEGNLTLRLGPLDPVNRVWTMFDVETMQWRGYSLDNGNQIWGPTNIDVRAYQYYGSGEGGGQRGAVAYGNLYVQGFGGEIFCISMANGNLLWKFNNTNSGLATPWGLRPIFLSAIADGKVYAFNNEHSPNVPLYSGHKVFCIDAYTGEEIWSILGWAGQTGGRGTSTAILADGFLVYYNYYDSQLYCVGKGPSTTTVSAPQTVVPKGTDVLITGTVTDQSAGAKAKVASGEFSTVPAVSDESQASWMEYVYMQKPMPADATGVEVKLTAYDPSGNPVNIGTTTTDTNGKYAITWTPSTEGTYYVMATFEGTNSYWASQDSTYFAVGVASSAQPTTPAETPSSTSTPSATGTVEPTISPSPFVDNPDAGITTETLLIIGAAVVIIAVVAAAAVLLRKRA